MFIEYKGSGFETYSRITVHKRGPERRAPVIFDSAVPCSRSPHNLRGVNALAKERLDSVNGRATMKSERPLKRLAHIIFALAVACAVSTQDLMAADSTQTGSEQYAVGTNEAPIEFWNRELGILRGTVAGVSPQQRAERAAERLEQLPVNVRGTDIVLVPFKVEGQDGIGFTYAGGSLFFVGSTDLEKESRETLEGASQRILRNIDDALAARAAERSWPVIRSALLYTFIGLLLIVLASSLIWKSHARLAALLRQRELAFRPSLQLFGVEFRPNIAGLICKLLRMVAWTLTVAAVYVWTTLSLRHFPYTQPWGNRLGSYVLQLFQTLGQSAAHAVPGLFAVAIILLITRSVTRMAKTFFDKMATSNIRISWIDPDIAAATQRVFAAIAWIFAVVVAYPYIPGSGTDAFKGIGVFVGLMVSFGSTGIINQVMSGLFVVYSKALKTGEWVQVNDIEGEVLEVGLLAGKIRTVEGQEVTIPNSVLVGTATKNYTRLGYPDGMIVSSTVSIGYDAPWRQVQALLLLAADLTPNVRKQPKPYVLQRQLSDFYVAYSLIARIESEKLRIETLSDLHAHIQDAFNEAGVQIMSPHFMMQPEGSVVVPPSKWYGPAPGARSDGASLQKTSDVRGKTND